MNLILPSLIISFAVQSVFYIVAVIFRTDKVTDLAYGIGFIAVSVILGIYNNSYETEKLVLVGFVVMWGIRLSGYLFIRILDMGRDKRFDGIRERFVSFSFFWVLQAVSIWIISFPVTIVISSPQVIGFNPLFLVGGCIWIAGFSIETIADYQKYSFKKKQENKERWIDSGLWRYSRYPNYFGEILCWWGVWIYTVPFLSGWDYISIVSPVYITILLLFVSGVPPLEKRHNKKYGDKKKYQKYKENTRLLVPLPK